MPSAHESSLGVGAGGSSLICSGAAYCKEKQDFTVFYDIIAFMSLARPKSPITIKSVPSSYFLSKMF